MRKRSLIIIALVTSVLSGFLVIHYYTNDGRLSLEKTKVIASGRVADMWFTPSGELHTLTVEDGIIEVKRWSLPNATKPEERSLDLGKLVSNLPIRLGHARGRREVGVLKDGGARDPLSVPFAIAPDSSIVVWWWRGELFFSDFGRTLRSVPTRLPQSVSSLSFYDTNLLLVIFEDGKVEAWNCKSRVKGEAGTWVEDGAWEVWSQGPIMALSSFASNDIGLLHLEDEGNTVKFQMFTLPSKEGTSAAVSEDGQLVIGTNAGQIQWITQDSTEKGTQLSEGGPVSAMAFYDERRLFAVGHEGRASFIKDRSEFRKLPGSRDISMLVASGRYLAIAVDDQVEFLELTLGRQWFKRRTFAILGALALIGIIVLVLYRMLPEAAGQWLLTHHGVLTISDVIVLGVAVVLGLLWIRSSEDPPGIYESLGYMLSLLPIASDLVRNRAKKV